MARDCFDALELSHPFNGVVSELPHDSPRESAFCSLPLVETTCGKMLYVVSAPPDVVGGRRSGYSATLCAVVLGEGDSYPRGELPMAKIGACVY